MNLNIRMGVRRFTRLTNAFSKKLENHCNALAIYFVFYNFCRKHKTLGMTPAQAARLTDEVLTAEDIIRMIDAANAPKKRGPYKKTLTNGSVEISNCCTTDSRDSFTKAAKRAVPKRNFT